MRVNDDRGRRHRRKYHNLAYKNKRRPITEETVDERGTTLSARTGGKTARRNVDDSKKKIITELAYSDGDANSEVVQNAIEALVANKLTARPDMLSSSETQLEDTWISMTKPDYKNSISRNKQNDCTYTLRRMSFGMFGQACEVEGMYSPSDHIVLSQSVRYSLLDGSQACSILPN